ncbi:hypothetical protein MCERH10_02728 [Caulobacteraceae bacterium]
MDFAAWGPGSAGAVRDDNPLLLPPTPIAPRGKPPGVHLVASLRSRGAGARGARQMRWARLTDWPGIRRKPCAPAEISLCAQGRIMSPHRWCHCPRLYMKAPHKRVLIRRIKVARQQVLSDPRGWTKPSERLDLRLHTAVGLRHTGHEDELILMKARSSHVCPD